MIKAEPCQASTWKLCLRPGRFDILDRADGKRWRVVCAIHERQIGRRNLVLAGYSRQQIEAVEKEIKEVRRWQSMTDFGSQNGIRH